MSPSPFVFSSFHLPLPPSLSLSPFLSVTEKATNPKNRYEDWEFIMAFCDKVNAEMEGYTVCTHTLNGACNCTYTCIIY